MIVVDKKLEKIIKVVRMTDDYMYGINMIDNNFCRIPYDNSIEVNSETPLIKSLLGDWRIKTLLAKNLTGNYFEAATVLNITERTFARKMNTHCNNV